MNLFLRAQSRRIAAAASLAMVSFTYAARLKAETPTSRVYGDTLDRQTQTAYVRGDVGFTTYESGATSSNSTGTTTTVEVGGSAGVSRTLGISFQSSQSEILFTPKNSVVESNFNDGKLRYRIGYFYPTAVGSMTRMRMKEEESTTADIFASGGGGGLGFKAPLTKEILIEGEGLLIKNVEAHDKLGAPVSFGDRMEAFVEASIDITQDMFDLIVGDRYRKFNMTLNERETTETLSSPYVGVRLGVYF